MTRQMIFVGLLLLSAATASAQQSVPVTATVSLADSSQPAVLVVNNYHAPLTAYNLRISLDKAVTEQPFDARINFRTASPILPGDSRSFPLVTRRTLPSGPRVLPTQIEIAAALFADGTSAGNATAVAQIKAYRQACLSQLQTIAAEFHVLSGQHLETRAVLESVESMKQNFLLITIDSAERAGGSFAYTLSKSILNDFRASTPAASGDDAMTAALTTIEGHIKALQMDTSPPERLFFK